MPGGTGGAQEGAASADEIIDHKCSSPLDLANEKVARDDTSASPLVSQSLADGPTEFSLQCLVKDVCTLGATRIRRNDTELLIP
jgi:hypothetical protein